MLLSVSEVAKMLKVNRNFVYNLIKNGELEAVKIGSIKVKKEALNRYIENNIIRRWCQMSRVNLLPHQVEVLKQTDGLNKVAYYLDM